MKKSKAIKYTIDDGHTEGTEEEVWHIYADFEQPTERKVAEAYNRNDAEKIRDMFDRRASK